MAEALGLLESGHLVCMETVGVRSEATIPDGADSNCPNWRNGVVARDARRILLAEDDSAFRHLLATTLRGDGYQVVGVADGTDLMDVLGDSLNLDSPEAGFDLVLSDLRMPGWPGLGALATVHRQPGIPPFILFTAFGDDETHRRARELGALALLDKPFDIDQLRRLVEQALGD